MVQSTCNQASSIVVRSWCSCYLATSCLQRWRSKGCAFCHNVLMHIQELSATWLPTTCASLLLSLHAFSRQTLSASFTVQSLFSIWGLGHMLQKKKSFWCYCVCYCYMQIQLLVANLPNHPADNWYSFGDNILKFDFVVWSAHQSEGERRCCTNNKLSSGRKMLFSNML